MMGNADRAEIRVHPSLRKHRTESHARMRLLSRVKRTFPGQALDRGDLPTLLHDCECEAGVHSPPVHQHRAGTELADAAALLAAG